MDSSQRNTTHHLAQIFAMNKPSLEWRNTVNGVSAVIGSKRFNAYLMCKNSRGSCPLLFYFMKLKNESNYSMEVMSSFVPIIEDSAMHAFWL